MFRNLPRVTKLLLLINIAVFVLQWLLEYSALGRAILDYLQLWPLGAGKIYGGAGFMPWQVLTYGFLHADFGHLLFNLIPILMFGAMIEHQWGARSYLTYYLVCVVGAGLCQLLVTSVLLHYYGDAVTTVGASGAVYGLILAFALLFPNQKITMLPFPIVLRARTLAMLYAGIALAYGIFGTREGVAHFAHLGGMLTGWLLIRYWQRRPPFGRRPPKKKKRSHLRVVH